MEQERQPMKGDGPLLLATRNSLFRLLSFLDSKLPEYCAVTALFTWLHNLLSIFILSGIFFSDSFVCVCGTANNNRQAIVLCLFSRKTCDD